jgi:NAD(P)-dependent dehydrogenase (short-subunit alcohol dehydrogenase family)
MQPEKTCRAIQAAALAKAFAVNAIGPALVAKHTLPLLARDRKVVFAALSARVGSIADNRLGGWHGYRASKAALNMLVRNFAIELATRNRQAVCVALHPGTVDTGLSGPFQAGVAPEKLFAPGQSASALLAVLDAATPERSGTLIAWDGQTIPF